MKIIISLILLLVLVSFVSAAPLVITGDLIAYYKFDSNLNDEQSNITLAEVGTITYAGAPFDNGLNYSENNYVKNTGYFSTRPLLENNWTIDFFVNVSSCTVGAGSNALFNLYTGANDHLYVRCDDGTNLLRFFARNVSGTLWSLSGAGGIVSGNSYVHVGVMQNATAVSLWLNGTQIGTSASKSITDIYDNLNIGFISTGVNGIGTMDNLAIWKTNKGSEYMIARYNSGSFAELGAAVPPDLLSVTLNTPTDTNINNTAQQNFSFTPVIDEPLSNCTLWENFDGDGNWKINQTNASAIAIENNTQWSFPLLTLNDGFYNWSVSCSEVDGDTVFASNFTLTIDTTPPTITINPDNFFNTSNKSTTNQYGNALILNITLLDDRDLFGFQINITKDGTSFFNFINLSLSGDTGYNYTEDINITTWDNGVYDIELITSDSIGGLNVVTENYQWYRGAFTDTNPELSTLESGEFTLNLTIDTSFITNINVTLIYNNTLREVTRVISGTFVYFNTTIKAPEITDNTNISYFWNVTVNQTGESFYDFLIHRNNTVFNWGLDNCTLFSTRALNFTIQDELNSSFLSADVSGRFRFAVDGINYRTFDLDVKSTSNFSICINPPEETFTVDYDLIFSASGYQQRDFEKVGDVLTNDTVVLPLYLLNNNFGIFQRFSVVDTFSNPLVDVRVRMETTISGTTRTIEEKLTDGSGFVRFFANPDVTYTFTFSKVGFATETFLLVPDPSTIRTIVLGEEVTEGFVSTGTGISYSFSPSNIVLNNNTDYTFMFNMTSNTFGITNCTLFLKNSSGDILSQSSSSFSTSACNIAITYNTGNLTFIKSEAKYTLDDDIDETFSLQYKVQATYVGEFSLMNFIDDVRDFGELGFNDFTRMFIAFIIMLGIVGTAAFKFGVTEPEVLTILSWILVLLFSFVGWLTLGLDTIPDIGPGKAWMQQYIILLVVTLLAGGYIINKQVD